LAPNKNSNRDESRNNRNNNNKHNNNSNKYNNKHNNRNNNSNHGAPPTPLAPLHKSEARWQRTFTLSHTLSLFKQSLKYTNQPNIFPKFVSLRPLMRIQALLSSSPMS